MTKAKRELTKGGGASHGVTCPQCGLPVTNAAQTAVFGAYVTDGDGYQEQFAACYNQWGGRVKNSVLPHPLSIANWMFYGAAGKRYQICTGDGFKHYKVKINQVGEGGRRSQPFVEFLWQQGVAAGQGRMEI